MQGRGANGLKIDQRLIECTAALQSSVPPRKCVPLWCVAWVSGQGGAIKRTYFRDGALVPTDTIDKPLPTNEIIHVLNASLTAD